MIAVSDEQPGGIISEIVDELRRALRESAAVAHALRRHREALVRIGAQAPEMMLKDRNQLSSGESAVDPWSTHEEVCRVLRLDCELRQRIGMLRGDLRRTGIGPELFE